MVLLRFILMRKWMGKIDISQKNEIKITKTFIFLTKKRYFVKPSWHKKLNKSKLNNIAYQHSIFQVTLIFAKNQSEVCLYLLENCDTNCEEFLYGKVGYEKFYRASCKNFNIRHSLLTNCNLCGRNLYPVLAILEMHQGIIRAVQFRV